MRLPAYPAYRPSGSETLRDLPAHWAMKRGRYCMQVNPRLDRLQDLPPDTEVSFVPMEAIGEYGGIDVETTRTIEDAAAGYSQFQDGDVVVAKITPCFENGKGALAAGLVNGAAFGTTELHVLRAEPAIDRRYLFYLSISSFFRSAGEAEMYGAGGQKRVPTEFIKDFPVPVPPLDEQRAAADFLDAKTNRLDQLLAKKWTLLRGLREQRAALVWRTVRQGIPADFPPSAADPGSGSLGPVPPHWRTVPLGYLVRFRGGATPDKNDSQYWNGDIPWVSPKDMKRPRIADTENHVSHDALRETSLSMIPENAVLVVVRGMILAHSFPVAITEAPVTINQDMKALIATSLIDSQFLAWALTGAQEALVALADESAHGTRKLETPVLAKFPIPVPPIGEQRAIAAYLQRVTSRLDRLATKVRTAIARLEEYRAALITAAVTGQIDVRGAAP